VVCVELEADAGRIDRASVVKGLRKMAAETVVTRGIDTFLFHSGFPVDVRHNAKIGREALAAWATKALS